MRSTALFAALCLAALPALAFDVTKIGVAAKGAAPAHAPPHHKRPAKQEKPKPLAGAQLDAVIAYATKAHLGPKAPPAKSAPAGFDLGVDNQWVLPDGSAILEVFNPWYANSGGAVFAAGTNGAGVALHVPSRAGQILLFDCAIRPKVETQTPVPFNVSEDAAWNQLASGSATIQEGHYVFSYLGAGAASVYVTFTPPAGAVFTSCHVTPVG